jgi:hypothetical protein
VGSQDQWWDCGPPGYRSSIDHNTWSKRPDLRASSLVRLLRDPMVLVQKSFQNAPFRLSGWKEAQVGSPCGFFEIP